MVLQWKATDTVALYILYAYPAKNVHGETKTQCILQVSGKSELMLDTMDRDRLTPETSEQRENLSR